MSDDREKDARAARIAGWGRVQLMGFGGGIMRWYGIRPDGCLQDVPAFGSDPAAARALLEVVPKEKWGAFIAALARRVGSIVMNVEHWEDFTDEEALMPLLLAPPAAIRDAVLEVMETDA